MTRNVVLIVGPPGAGKTTYAHTLGFTVYDRDDYPSDKAFRSAAQQAASHPEAIIAVIRCCETWQEQRRWEQELNTTQTIVIDTPLDECRRRIHKRKRPQWRGEIKAAERWHTSRAQQAHTPSRAW